MNAIKSITPKNKIKKILGVVDVQFVALIKFGSSFEGVDGVDVVVVVDVVVDVDGVVSIDGAGVGSVGTCSSNSFNWKNFSKSWQEVQ